MQKLILLCFAPLAFAACKKEKNLTRLPDCINDIIQTSRMRYRQ